jgi:two-component system, cell cycle sensor histidine kinase and response regulator CckA
MVAKKIQIDLKAHVNLRWGYGIAVATVLLVCAVLWSSFMQAVANRQQGTTLYARILEAGITRTIESIELSLKNLSDDIRPSTGGYLNLDKIQDRIQQIVQFAPHIRQIVLTKGNKVLVDSIRKDNAGKDMGRIDFKKLAFPAGNSGTFSSGIQIAAKYNGRFLPRIGDNPAQKSSRSLLPLALEVQANGPGPEYFLLVGLNPGYIRLLFEEFKITGGDHIGLLNLDGVVLIERNANNIVEKAYQKIHQLVTEGKDESRHRKYFGIIPNVDVSYRLSEKFPLAIQVSADHRYTLDLWLKNNLLLVLGLIATTGLIIGGVFVLMRDHLRTAALQEQVRLLSTAVHQSPISIVISDNKHTIRYVNSAFAKTFGYGGGELHGKHASILADTIEGKDILPDMEAASAYGKYGRREFLAKSKSNKEVHISSLISPILDEGGVCTHVISIMSDVTERHQDQEALLKLSQAVEQSPAIVVITNTDGEIEYANPKFVETSGYSVREVLGENPSILSSGEKSREEYSDLWKAISAGREWRGEFHNKRKDGSLYWESALISPIKSPDGTILNYLAVKEDITEKKNLEGQVRRSQKLEAVGHLTGGIAHDFNNILAIVIGNLELLQRLLHDNDKALTRIEKAYRGAKRGADLTQKLLRFSRKDPQQISTFILNESVNNLKELIAKSLTASITVRTELVEDLWPVAVDRGDLDDSLLNLSLNARDAMPDGGELVIETANKAIGKNLDFWQPESVAGEYAMIAISDNGEGMTEEVKENALEPFFTSKELGKGTGLGLSMVYGFVKRAGGQIEIVSAVGQGTTVRIYLPRATIQPEQKINPEFEGELPRGTETILVIDDEEDLRDVASTNLRDLGYNVLTAENGQQALQILAENKNVDLMFSDIVMPGELDGYKLSQAAHDSSPELKILLTSGFTQAREDHENGDNKFLAVVARRILKKPYSREQLALHVRLALDESIVTH